MNTRFLYGALALLLATPALAADLPARRAPPVYAPPIPVFSWEGFYVGGQAGYAFGRDGTLATLPAVAPIVNAVGGFPGLAVAQTFSPSGVIGGGHVGYNVSSRPFFGSLLGSAGIVGIEGDVDGADYHKTVFGPPFGLSGSDYAKLRSDIQGSVRGRIGIAFDRALFYATGGAAFADFKTSYSVTGVGFDAFSHSRLGYTIGGGVEYAFTDHIALRAEYRYSDYGSFTDTLVNSSLIAGTTVRHHETMNRVQAGLSYLFSTPPAPVVARY